MFIKHLKFSQLLISNMHLKRILIFKLNMEIKINTKIKFIIIKFKALIT